MSPPFEKRIGENLAEVEGRIAEAALRSGRRPGDVRLVAVTKYVEIELIEPLLARGCRTLGESRPQHLWPKAEALAGRDVAWHMIGPLQRNKVRRTLPLVEMIHSADSIRLVETIDRIAAELQRSARLLLEVNASGDQAKHGLADAQLEDVLSRLAEYRHVEVCGLMCMAGLDSGPEETRREFARLRHTRDRLRSSCPGGAALEELSMGMSGDYEIAIEEGATIVRVGSALFEGVLK